jgi:Flp pilus assembly secretin CpaC
MFSRSCLWLATLLLVSLTEGAVHSSIAADALPARTIALAVGASEILRTRPGVATIVLGNPVIADASVINGTTIAITGKMPGGTNLILLDASGGEISRAVLQIGSRQTQVVVFGGEKTRNYSCAPNCITTPDSAPLETTASISVAPVTPSASGRSVVPAGTSTEVGGPE